MPNNIRILCVLVLILIIHDVISLTQLFTSVKLKGPLQNLRTYKDKLYIGGTNMIYMLNKDLRISKSASTCTSSSISCANVNKVLHVLEKRREILVCGTGKNGECEIRSTDDIGTILWTNPSDNRSPMKVSTDPSRPAQSIVTMNDNVMFAVSYGDGISSRASRYLFLTYDYAISTRNISDFEPVFSMHGKKVLNVDIHEKYFQEYIIYFKDVFQFNWYTYFVTNQKRTVKSIEYVSKLANVCQNDTSYKTYTDIMMSCVYDGVRYNLIQEAVIIDAPDSFGFEMGDKIFVGAFTRGVDPTNPSGSTAICLSKISAINQDVLKAKKKHALSCIELDPSDRYLESSSNCISEKDLKFGDYGTNCELECLNCSKVIGNLTHSMTATYLVDSMKGHVTALDGVAVSEENIVLIAGTSTGLLLQMTIESLVSPIEVFSTADVRSPIRRVHIEDDHTLYALGSHNVFSFSLTNCSGFTTCASTIASRNPYCGWCVYKQRATRKSECSNESNHWISSLQKCQIKMNLSQSSIPVSSSNITNVRVTLTVEYLPKPQTEDIFKCRLVDGHGEVIAPDILAERNGKVLTCAMPLISEHVELEIELYVNTALNQFVLLSTAAILFFECGKFERCGDCIDRSSNYCFWCNDEVMCLSRESTCKIIGINTSKFCPQLTDSRGMHYAHAGIMTSVLFQGKHLPLSGSGNKFFYTCQLNSSTSSSAVTINTSIACSVNVPHLSDRQLQDKPIQVYYGLDRARTSILEDRYKNYVTIYNCTMLARDCSHCQALNKTRFDCAWCTNTNRCGYRDRNCSATKCPAPTITDVIPRDGPVMGNTLITIDGLNLGSCLADIDSVEVAKIPCNISDDLSLFNATEYGNFETRAPNLVICLTNSSLNETSGAVSISVSGQVSKSDIMFSYRVPAVTNIVPHFGPEAGGTRVTISGENLGIGNRNVRVQLEDKSCLRPEVKPKLPLGNISPANLSIVCTVDKGYTSNITVVTITIDDVIVVTEEPVSFTFVRNPELLPLSPKKAFLSGGTKIMVEGINLNSAGNARITLNYRQDMEIGDCIIMSESLANCQVPKAPGTLRNHLLESERTKYIRVVSVIYFDNVHKNFEIAYYHDPTIDNLAGSDRVVELEADDRRLKITGKMLNYVATVFDISITVGVESCVIVELKSSYFTCIAPKYKPKSGIPFAKLPEVNVTIGNIKKMVGFVDYKTRSLDFISSPLVMLSAAGIGAVLILVISMATILICRQYRHMKSRLQILANQNRITEDDTGVIRFSRLAGKANEIEYSSLYNDITDSHAFAHYSTITAEDIAKHREETEWNSQVCPCEHLPDVNTLPKREYQDTLAKSKITVEIQLEGSTATNVEIIPKDGDDQSYLHAIGNSTG